jgi:glutathione S-transferase
MILVGQYDSPFVRRVAVTMNCYDIAFKRRVLSVFGNFDEVLHLNPLGKVPILELDDGERLFDSRAILDYLDELAPPEMRMVPIASGERRTVLRVDAVAVGLAEKLYERGIEFARRDASKRDPVIIERVETQIFSALSWLEGLKATHWLCGEHMSRADVSSAIAYTYLIEKQPGLVQFRQFPLIAAHRERCEALLQFKAAAYSASEAAASGWRP